MPASSPNELGPASGWSTYAIVASSPPATSIGTLAFELSDPLTTYLGWLLPWGSPLSLIGRSRDDLAAARRALARIGIDRIAACGLTEGEHGEDVWAGLATGSYPIVGFRDLQAVHRRSRRGRGRRAPRP